MTQALTGKFVRDQQARLASGKDSIIGVDYDMYPILINSDRLGLPRQERSLLFNPPQIDTLAGSAITLEYNPIRDRRSTLTECWIQMDVRNTSTTDTISINNPYLLIKELQVSVNNSPMFIPAPATGVELSWMNQNLCYREKSQRRMVNYLKTAFSGMSAITTGTEQAGPTGIGLTIPPLTTQTVMLSLNIIELLRGFIINQDTYSIKFSLTMQNTTSSTQDARVATNVTANAPIFSLIKYTNISLVQYFVDNLSTLVDVSQLYVNEPSLISYRLDTNVHSPPLVGLGATTTFKLSDIVQRSGLVGLLFGVVSSTPTGYNDATAQLCRGGTDQIAIRYFRTNDSTMAIDMTNAYDPTMMMREVLMRRAQSGFYGYDHYDFPEFLQHDSELTQKLGVGSFFPIDFTYTSSDPDVWSATNISTTQGSIRFNDVSYTVTALQNFPAGSQLRVIPVYVEIQDFNTSSQRWQIADPGTRTPSVGVNTIR